MILLSSFFHVALVFVPACFVMQMLISSLASCLTLYSPRLLFTLTRKESRVVGFSNRMLEA
jgi:hypothetical protein